MRKKQISKAVISGFMIAAFFLQTIKAQTVDEIVEKHTVAMGGKEKLESLKTISIEGTFRLEKFELPLKAYLANNIGQRYDVMVMKVPGFIIATPKDGWQYFPFQGMTEPKPIKPEELDAYLPYMDLQGALYNYKEKGSIVEYKGVQEIDDNVCYKLLATLKSGKKILNYVDTGSYYIVRTDLQILTNGKETLLENRYANFQKTLEGYVFPFALTLGPGQAFVSKIYVNKPIEPLLFNPIESKKTTF
jgi:hypothetical protein